jgi:3,4-dihydroxy 2-butanone 4-phosphate synthase/GTP cyclohydrolase II
MARLPDQILFAELHGLKFGTIADLIAYRRRTERQVERVLEGPFESVHGGHFRFLIYRNTIDGAEHVVLTKGKIEADEKTLVRMHRVDFAADMLGHVDARHDFVPLAMQAVADYNGAGVIVFLRDPSPSWMSERYGGMQPSEQRTNALRDYGVGAQILLDLGVREMEILATRPIRPAALDGYGLKIVGWRPIGGGQDNA